MKKLRRIRYYKNKNIILIFLLIVSITVGYAAIQTKLNINGTLSVVLTRWDFDYTGGEQVFTVPETGIYKLEAWGAQGANVGDSEAGYGGYSTGEIYLTKNEKLYINVGGTGSTAEGNHSYCTQDAIVVLGGYNGGGTAFAGSQDVGSGGGATHIALISGTLASIGYENFVTYNKGLIVAGGGGGGSLNGSGGGISGVSGSTASPGVYRFYSLGGTQTSGGGNYNCVGECSLSPAGIYDGVFGQGGDGNNSGGCSGSSSGGAADWGNSSGGGATDIRLVNGNWNSFDSLKSRIMVAAGGAGSDTSNTAGSGGGLQGYDAGVVNDSQGYATGATQTRGGEYIGIYAGKIGYFGYAGYHNNDNGGGSGGYYGGVTGVGYRRSGSGGSSFISGHVGCDAILESSIESSISHTNQSIHYSGLMFLNTEMIDGEGHRWTHKKLGYVGQIQPDGNITAGHSGNGSARITYLGN